MSILSSPLLRAVKTAEIISTEIYHHVDHSIPSANVIATKALQNPSKHTDLNRHDFLSKFLLDQPIELWELLWRVISSPEESMDILVTHGTVARYANLLLTNLGSEGSITGSAIPIKGDMGDIHLIR